MFRYLQYHNKLPLETGQVGQREDTACDEDGVDGRTFQDYTESMSATSTVVTLVEIGGTAHTRTLMEAETQQPWSSMDCNAHLARRRCDVPNQLFSNSLLISNRPII